MQEPPYDRGKGKRSPVSGRRVAVTGMLERKKSKEIETWGSRRRLGKL